LVWGRLLQVGRPATSRALPRLFALDSLVLAKPSRKRPQNPAPSELPLLYPGDGENDLREIRR